MKHLPILLQTEHYVVVAKPPNLMVHRSKLSNDRHYALQILRRQLGRQVNPIHRLDRPTSGCLVFAFDSEWAATLHSGLRSADATKEYLAFVRGYFEPDEPVVVENPMKDAQGVIREARSVVRVLGRSHQPRCSLLLVTPRTGRFHQVRRHVRDLDHPVICDSKHGDTRVNRVWREEWGLSRLGLHCLRLDLPLPDGRLQVTCPVPEDLQRVWRQMPWWDEAVQALPALDLPPAEAMDDGARGDGAMAGPPGGQAPP